MPTPIVHGPSFSTYVRAACMTLEEKEVEYRRQDIDRSTAEFRQRYNPFGKIPVLEHGDLRLYETRAICRYVDDAFDGPSLQPSDPLRIGRMEQIVGIVDAYLYGRAVTRLLIPRFLPMLRGGEPDEETIAAAVPEAREALAVIDGLMGEAPFLTGDTLSLADLHLFPITAGLNMAPESEAVFIDAPRLAAWTTRMSQRTSADRTVPQLPG